MHITVVQQGEQVTVEMAGRFDFSSRLRFKRVRAEVLAAPSVREVDLDFSRVTHIDSAALGMLLIMRDEVEAVRKRVRVCNSVGAVREILGLANLGRLMAD